MRVESPSQAVLDELATPVLWLDAAGAIAGANGKFFGRRAFFVPIAAGLGESCR